MSARTPAERLARREEWQERLDDRVIRKIAKVHESARRSRESIRARHATGGRFSVEELRNSSRNRKIAYGELERWAAEAEAYRARTQEIVAAMDAEKIWGPDLQCSEGSE
jgi:hypothetical protein